MAAPRGGLQRLAACRTTMLASSRQSALRFTFSSRSAGRILQRRLVATESLSSATARDEILAKQRLNRPVVPSLTIYKPQITWVPSMFHRLTAVILSGGLYLFGLGYLVAPVAGWHLESQVLAQKFGDLPRVVKGTIKTALALPFAFHSYNGLRHLAWDMGWGFAKGAVIRSGWFVVGLSLATSAGLAAL